MTSELGRSGNAFSLWRTLAYLVLLVLALWGAIQLTGRFLGRNLGSIAAGVHHDGSRVSDAAERVPTGSVVLIEHDTIARILFVLRSREPSGSTTVSVAAVRDTAFQKLPTIDSTMIAVIDARSEQRSPMVIQLRRQIPPDDWVYYGRLWILDTPQTIATYQQRNNLQTQSSPPIVPAQ